MPKTISGSVFATRGCSYNCSYCCLKSIYHHSFRTRPLPEIMDDIASMRNSFFVFWDDNLFNDHTYAKELFRQLTPLKKRWAAQVTIDDCRDVELLSLAGKAGCIYLFIGLESFSQESL
ncbi:MAG TPA: B12-binding domain-containing radical SAM protein, partial [Bacteroidales bacterium]|nr:B12-binding domain-containing radical SAM protein [Bacteroidales bacterium]